MAILKRKKVEISSTDASENAIANKETEGLSQRQIVFRRFVRHRAAMISVFTLIFLILFVYTALDFKIGPWNIHGWWKYKVEDLPELRYKDCPNGNVGCPTFSLRPKFLGGSGFGLGDHPFGQELQRPLPEPDHAAGQHHHAASPDERPIFNFLHVGEMSELRGLALMENIVFLQLEEIP